MLTNRSLRLGALRAITRSVLIVTVALAGFSIAQAAPAATNDARSFFSSIVGEWIGTCQQSTNGKQADDKYFHAVVKQVDANTFSSNFDYYRLDKNTGKPISIGTSSVSTTIGPNGVAQNRIQGKGTMMVDSKPKQQQHDFKEVLSAAPDGLHGQGSGTLSVFGMPLGLGKNGKISKAASAWSLQDGVLTINQNLQAGFRAFVFSKSFSFVACYTARRGADVASVITRPGRVSSRPFSPAPAGAGARPRFTGNAMR